jgi:2,4-dienoyl-CoA reductase-like NADH-dependent reductase (Old Yellow Enzyme family)
LREPSAFRTHLARLGVDIPCDESLSDPAGSPLAQPIDVGAFHIGNRFAIHPMEGWDGTPDGRPTEATIRRWQRFGASGAKLIWGGEAIAVRHDGRANPNQLLIGEENAVYLANLRQVLVDEHLTHHGRTDDLVIGLQLTHSGRYSKPNFQDRPEPQIAFRHPILDRRLHLGSDYHLLSDGDIRSIIESFHDAARIAWKLGFDFVDIKHCHGYLGHELLAAHTREGAYGGSFENRTRFLREIVQGIRSLCPQLGIAVRLSCFDTIPYCPDPAGSVKGKPGRGIPERFEGMLPYRFGFGVSENDPTRYDLAEPIKFLELLQKLDIRLVNLTAGSPYYNPHIQRPALYPPSDGYQPPEDPLLGVARQMNVARQLKQRFPGLVFVGSAYTYLQDFFPLVAQAAVREGWIDSVGLGRMVLSYPELPADILAGRPLQVKRTCRTFSDCTTAPRNGLPSGCYPLDEYYSATKAAAELKAIKRNRKE